MAVEAPCRLTWEWDDNERGIVLDSQDAAPRELATRAASRLQLPGGPGGAGGLLAGLDVTFVDVVDALDLVRFRRHWQRRVQCGLTDIVTLRDVKDVVLFQVQQELPADFLRLFHSPAVDRFLRTLILYCFHYIQTWEWITFMSMANEKKITEPGLRPSQRRKQSDVATLRVLLGRDYHTLLLGLDGSSRKSHQVRWSHREARHWELLLRLAVRVTWVALQRRHLNLIDAEVGRLFRGEPFNLAARQQQQQSGARVRAGHISCRNMSRAQAIPRLEDVRDEILHGSAVDLYDRYRSLFTRSPATLEVLGRHGVGHHWTLLALGRMFVPSLAPRLRLVEAVYTLSEDELVREHGSFIGILGMPRNNLDVMLRDKQRRQEVPLSTAGRVSYSFA